MNSPIGLIVFGICLGFTSGSLFWTACHVRAMRNLGLTAQRAIEDVVKSYQTEIDRLRAENQRLRASGDEWKDA